MSASVCNRKLLVEPPQFEEDLYPPVGVNGVSPVTNPVRMNWCGLTSIARKAQIIRPSCIKEIIDLLREGSHRQIKVVGSGLSFEAIASIDANNDDAVLIDMENFNGLEFLDAQAGTARFGAGTPVDSVIQTLSAHGLMMPVSPGVIGIQTIAGAISTATHGQGMYQSTLSDMVQSLRIIRADGTELNIDETHAEFGAYIASLGVLGVIVSVTIKTVPLRSFICRKLNVSYETFAANWVSWNRESEFCKAWWYPDTNLVHVWKVDEDDGDQVRSNADSTLNATIDMLSEKMADHTKDPGLIGNQFATIERFRNTVDQKGFLHEIVCKGIPVPQINCEIAIPIDQLPGALNALIEWLAKHGTSSLHYPFIFRCTAQSKAWLSPSSIGPVCYIGFLVYLAHDGTWAKGSMEIMESLQRALLPHHGIPHFGKHFCLATWNPRDLLPRWRDFEQLRQSLDPSGRFLNQFLSQLFKLSPIS